MEKVEDSIQHIKFAQDIGKDSHEPFRESFEHKDQSIISSANDSQIVHENKNKTH